MLYIHIKMPREAIDQFEIDTNIKEEKLSDMLANVLRSQMGKGTDDSTPSEVDVFEVEITIDLSFDNIHVKSNTGNKGLTTGIIMFVNQKIRERMSDE